LIQEPIFKTNPLRTENYRALRAEIELALEQDTTTGWLARLSEKQIPCAQVNNVKDLFEYPQLAARAMLVQVDSEDNFRVVGNPIKFKGEAIATHKKRPPALGEHNDFILRQMLGYTDAEVRQLERSGVVAGKGGTDE
jgi:crotonobetainyl-CoA:carnitine CoA-transferase CaiB-like acyl-CoA transferase